MLTLAALFLVAYCIISVISAVITSFAPYEDFAQDILDSDSVEDIDSRYMNFETQQSLQEATLANNSFNDDYDDENQNEFLEDDDMFAHDDSMDSISDDDDIGGSSFDSYDDDTSFEDNFDSIPDSDFQLSVGDLSSSELFNND